MLIPSEYGKDSLQAFLQTQELILRIYKKIFQE